MAFSETDPIAPLHTLLNGITDDFNSKFAVRQIKTYRWANTAARTATTGMSNGDEGYQIDTGAFYDRTGSAWVIQDTGWVDATLLNGWVNIAGDPVRYRRRGGVVYMSGRASGGTATTVLTLGVGFRPGPSIRAVARVGTGNSICYIETHPYGTVFTSTTGDVPNFSNMPAFIAEN